MKVLTDRSSILAVLHDPCYDVLVAPATTSRDGLAWLRATGPRFRTGDDHARRRAIAVALLAAVDPAPLQPAAAEHAASLRAAGHPLAVMAYRTPVTVLAEVLAVHEPDQPGPSIADLVAHIAPAYPTGSTDAGTSEADAAVDQLIALCGGRADEHTAVRIALLVQAYEGTARLILGAVAHGGIDQALLVAPPVPALRRRSPDGELLLDLAAAGGGRALAFGAGLRPCPGQAHALALAAGVLSTVESLDDGADKGGRR
jgi:hypothetical protein